MHVSASPNARCVASEGSPKANASLAEIIGLHRRECDFRHSEAVGTFFGLERIACTPEFSLQKTNIEHDIVADNHAIFAQFQDRRRHFSKKRLICNIFSAYAMDAACLQRDGNAWIHQSAKPLYFNQRSLSIKRERHKRKFDDALRCRIESCRLDIERDIRAHFPWLAAAHRVGPRNAFPCAISLSIPRRGRLMFWLGIAEKRRP